MILEAREIRALKEVTQETLEESQEKKELSQKEKDQCASQATNQLTELAEENFPQERKTRKFSFINPLCKNKKEDLWQIQNRALLIGPK